MRKILLFLVIVLTMIMFSGCDGNSTGNNKAPEPPYAPTPDNNSANIGNVTTLSWTCYDPEDDNLTYRIYIGKVTPILVASDLTTNSYIPEVLDYSTNYYWKVEANDGHSTTKSPQWKFHTVEEDMPASEPSNSHPEDNIIDIEIDQLLQWYCYDLNGDALTFDIRIGTTVDPPIVETGLVNLQYNVTDLEYHTMYYWQVIANSTTMTTEGPLWCFETRYYNYPPGIPKIPRPINNATGVSTHTNMLWQCDDPENDPLNYNIYFGTENNPPLLVQGYQSTIYEPGNLEANSTYCWRIDAWDGTNYSYGPVWHFSTGNPNTEPDIPSVPWPSDEADEESIHAALRWTCHDPDGDDLSYKVYFGTVPVLTEYNVIKVGIENATLELETLDYNTTYYWKITASDGELDATSPTWSFATEIYIPNP